MLLKGASERGAKKIRIHVLTDGRDVLDGSSVGHAETLEKDLSELRGKGIDAQIASGGGRMYVTMDRYEVKCLKNMSLVLEDNAKKLVLKRLIKYLFFWTAGTSEKLENYKRRQLPPGYKSNSPKGEAYRIWNDI